MVCQARIELPLAYTHTSIYINITKYILTAPERKMVMPRTKVIDELYEYQGLSRLMSHCRVRIYR